MIFPTATDPVMNHNTEEMECLVFRTNIRDKNEVKLIAESIENIPDIAEWSVDLEDWEKVLRVVGTGVQAREIKSRLRSHNVMICKMPVYD